MLTIHLPRHMPVHGMTGLEVPVSQVFQLHQMGNRTGVHCPVGTGTYVRVRITEYQ